MTSIFVDFWLWQYEHTTAYRQLQRPLNGCRYPNDRNLFRLHRLAFSILLSLSFWAGACAVTGGTAGSTNSPGDKEATSFSSGIKIESIWSHPETFRDQKVLVRGRYLGWKGQIGHPQITRSDWAMEDNTGTIYVTGLPAKGLNPLQDIGHPLEVLGTVRVNPEGVPYIRAERVIVEVVQ
jgi:hypothetical protein